jgi:hypothetical protein
MDPDALLTELRRLANEFMNGPVPLPDNVYELASGFLDLDTWLGAKGGFLPTDWQPQPVDGGTLDASISHLPPEVRYELNSFVGVTADETTDGWSLFVPPNIDQHLVAYADEEPIPRAVITLWREASSLGCRWVRLDDSGPRLPDLPTYD